MNHRIYIDKEYKFPIPFTLFKGNTYTVYDIDGELVKIQDCKGNLRWVALDDIVDNEYKHDLLTRMKKEN